MEPLKNQLCDKVDETLEGNGVINHKKWKESRYRIYRKLVNVMMIKYMCYEEIIRFIINNE